MIFLIITTFIRFLFFLFVKLDSFFPFLRLRSIPSGSNFSFLRIICLFIAKRNRRRFFFEKIYIRIIKKGSISIFFQGLKLHSLASGKGSHSFGKSQTFSLNRLSWSNFFFRLFLGFLNESFGYGKSGLWIFFDFKGSFRLVIRLIVRVQF